MTDCWLNPYHTILQTVFTLIKFPIETDFHFFFHICVISFYSPNECVEEPWRHCLVEVGDWGRQRDYWRIRQKNSTRVFSLAQLKIWFDSLFQNGLVTWILFTYTLYTHWVYMITVTVGERLNAPASCLFFKLYQANNDVISKLCLTGLLWWPISSATSILTRPWLPR